MPQITPVPPKNARKSRSGLSLKRVKLNKVRDQLLNVLAREAQALLIHSHTEPLTKDQSQSLLGYIKLLKDLEKSPLNPDNMTIEALEKIANKL